MNIPKSAFDDAFNVMVVGIGGGFDVFTGLPFVYSNPSKNFILVNHIPSDLIHFRESVSTDYPHGEITERSNIIAKYSIGAHGYGAAKSAYQQIANKHGIDCILAVDGGVDSLAVGDEESNGTILEDFIAMAALSDIPVKKVLCCAGFGTETEEDMNHYRILENMSALAADKAFLGSFSLTSKMTEFYLYKDECNRVWENKRKSHIQTKIISAVEGGFGKNNYENVDPRLAHSTGIEFVSLLSSIFWMFDFDAVIKRNKVIPTLKKGNTFVDSKMLLKQYFSTLKNKRSKLTLPL